jgi:hypothetical protein
LQSPGYLSFERLFWGDAVSKQDEPDAPRGEVERSSWQLSNHRARGGRGNAGTSLVISISHTRSVRPWVATSINVKTRKPYK